MATHVIIGCGKDKRPGILKAKDKYQSGYFTVKREFGEAIGDRVGDEFGYSIYSAKHGIIRPGTEIGDYNVEADDVPDDVLRERVESTLSHIPDAVDRVVVCAGKSYVDPTRDVFEDAFGDVEFYFDDTDGMGDQMAKMKTATRRSMGGDITQYE